jgi:hypothetical protein
VPLHLPPVSVDVPDLRDRLVSAVDITTADTFLVEATAKRVAARYVGIEADDVTQEVWMWWLTKGDKYVQAYKADLARAEGESNREAVRQVKALMGRSVNNAAVRYCEKERKATLGYDWRDDYTYTRPEVARLLPLALDPSTIPGLSGGGLHDGPSAKSDPAYGGGMLASIADVRSAFGKLSPSDQDYVKLVVQLDTQWDIIASHLGLQANSAYAKYMRILDRMVTRHLGRAKDEDDAA